MTEIKVEHSIKINIGNVKAVLDKKEAEELYNLLGKILGKHIIKDFEQEELPNPFEILPKAPWKPYQPTSPIPNPWEFPRYPATPWAYPIIYTTDNTGDLCK